MFPRKLEKCSLNWFNMDSDESWLMELKLSGMIENLKHEMSGGFEYRIHDLTVKLETYIRANENLKEQLRQTEQ